LLVLCVVGAFRVIEHEVDVFLALELVGYSFDHLDQHQTVVYFLHAVVQFIRLDLGLHCFRALAPNDRVECTLVGLVDFELFAIHFHFLVPNLLRRHRCSGRIVHGLQYFGALHEFHHLLDVGGVVLEMKTHIVSKLLHGSGEMILLGHLSITLEDMSVHLRQSTLEGIRVARGSSCVMVDVVLSTRSSGCASVCGSSSCGSVCPGTHVLFGLYFLLVLFLVYTFFSRLSNEIS
jgi:hypothetical protein